MFSLRIHSEQWDELLAAHYLTAMCGRYFVLRHKSSSNDGNQTAIWRKSYRHISQRHRQSICLIGDCQKWKIFTTAVSSVEHCCLTLDRLNWCVEYELFIEHINYDCVWDIYMRALNKRVQLTLNFFTCYNMTMWTIVSMNVNFEVHLVLVRSWLKDNSLKAEWFCFIFEITQNF